MYGDCIGYNLLFKQMSIEDQLQVWSWIFNKRVEVGEVITSPFRPDNSPNSCFLKRIGNVLFFTDWAEDLFTKMTCVHGIYYFRQTNLNECSQFIYDNLKAGKRPIFLSNVKKAGFKRSVKKGHSNISFIPFLFNTKPAWTEVDREYWSKRKITSIQLEDNSRGGRVYSVHRFYVNGIEFYPKTYPCYAYSINDRLKIYQPLSDKKYKWYSSINKDDYWFTGRQSDTIMLAKSQKEHMISENLFPTFDIVSGMSEKIHPELFISSKKRRISILDNDRTGIQESIKLKNSGVEVYIIEDKMYKDLDNLMTNNKIEQNNGIWKLLIRL